MNDRFTPPPPVDEDTRERLLDALGNTTELYLFLLDYRSRHDPRLLKYRKRLEARDKESKRRRRINWWRDNWIAFLSLIFSFIAAAPVIIQGIETILGWLR